MDLIIIFDEIFLNFLEGVVYMGFWRKSKVAVKQLISAKYTEKELQDFKTEADLLMYVNLNFL